MKFAFLYLLCINALYVNAQFIDSLNTANSCLYMTPVEKEMIWEINRLRSNPTSYLPYLLPLLADAQRNLKSQGKGQRNYSLTISSTSGDGKNLGSIDTTWNFENEEEVKALNSLITDLKNVERLSILQPDRGIYNAAKKHAADQQLHDYKLLHTGSDGSLPLERIISFSPLMAFGGENIGGRYGYATATARDFVLELLIDSGIPGYGHRYNILNPLWTHIGCVVEKFKGTDWWIQDFGVKK